MTRNTEEGDTEEGHAEDDATAERATAESRAENAARLLRQLAALVPDAVEADRSARGEAAADIRAGRCLEVFRALRDDESLSFDLLIAISRSFLARPIPVNAGMVKSETITPKRSGAFGVGNEEFRDVPTKMCPT